MHHIHDISAVEMLHLSFVKTGGAVTEGEEGFSIKQTKNEDLGDFANTLPTLCRKILQNPVNESLCNMKELGIRGKPAPMFYL